MAERRAEARRDMHVHSTFSDGRGSIAENITVAERLRLDELTCVDHVRESTDWVPDYVAAVEEARGRTAIRLHCGIEAKLLDTRGRLDLPSPDQIAGVDRIYAADHQVPLVGGPHPPREVRERIEVGELRAREVLEAITSSTAAAVASHDNVVIAHLFSVLPKIGLKEAEVPIELIEVLAESTAEAGSARIEIDERWNCPSARTLGPFRSRGVEILLSTDSHRPDTIGRYDYCLRTLDELYRSGTGAS